MNTYNSRETQLLADADALEATAQRIRESVIKLNYNRRKAAERPELCPEERAITAANYKPDPVQRARKIGAR